MLKQDQNQTMIISADLMAENEKFDTDSSDYKKSSLKRKIETDILPLLEEDFGAENIVEHEVSLTTVDMQEDYGTLTCKVRPVTFDEAREFNDLLVNKELSDWYWACTPWSTEERGYECSTVVVSPQGNINRNNSNNNNGVRPFCIKQTVRVGIKPKSGKDTKRYAAFRIAVNTKEFWLWMLRVLSRIFLICTGHLKMPKVVRVLMEVVRGFR